MDETYIKVKGIWKYLYRAVDKEGKTVDFLLTAKRDKAAAMRFFAKAMQTSGVPTGCGFRHDWQITNDDAIMLREVVPIARPICGDTCIQNLI